MIRRTVPHLRLIALAGAAVTVTAVVTGCGDDAATDDAGAITVSQQWVKAADTGMTAAFGVVANDSDRDVRIVSAASDAAARTELHEVVESGGTMTMREKRDGFTVPAHGQITLKPGAEHIMLMDLTRPIRSGDTVTVTVTFGDGSAERVDAVARDFDGNQENYVPNGHK